MDATRSRPRAISASVILTCLLIAFFQLQEEDLKDVASTLSQLAGQIPSGGLSSAALYTPAVATLPPGLEPGPSSHPGGPPNLGEERPQGSTDDGVDDGDDGELLDGDDPSSHAKQVAATAQHAARRGARSATMSNDEWVRQRKDNHVSYCLGLHAMHTVDAGARRKRLSVDGAET
jgi:hypothetical protein